MVSYTYMNTQLVDLKLQAAKVMLTICKSMGKAFHKYIEGSFDRCLKYFEYEHSSQIREIMMDLVLAF